MGVNSIGPNEAIASEAEVLGSILVVASVLGAVLAEVNLRADHFYLERHRILYGCLVAMRERGSAIDEVLVISELKRRGELDQVGGEHEVSNLASTVGSAGNAMHHARLIVQKAEWRLRAQAGQQILAAAASEDGDALALGEELLSKDVAHQVADYDPPRLADLVQRIIDSGGIEAFPWPFNRLNQITAGGMRRGELIIVAGHTSHGKSVLMDQMLDTAARAGKRVRLYMNEMSLEERAARALTRRTGVPYARIVQGRTEDWQRSSVVKELTRGLPWGITNVPGWTANEVCHHIRSRRWDLVVVDHLHEFDYEDEKDIRRMASTFARTAKLANCTIVLGAQLNERRVSRAVLPKPTMGDLKGSSQIKQAADMICFVYREQDEETAEPLLDGQVYLSKARGGPIGGLKVRFEAAHLRFELPPEEDL